jgi:DNA-binding XRE family transcriptional regulator
MSKSFTGSAQGVAEGFTELTQARLIADLRAARVEAGISSEDAAKTLGIPREVFDDVEAGRINLNMTEIREYAWVVGAVIEYSVTKASSSEINN